MDKRSELTFNVPVHGDESVDDYTLIIKIINYIENITIINSFPVKRRLYKFLIVWFFLFVKIVFILNQEKGTLGAALTPKTGKLLILLMTIQEKQLLLL